MQGGEEERKVGEIRGSGADGARVLLADGGDAGDLLAATS